MLGPRIRDPIWLYVAHISTFYYAVIGAVTTGGAGYAASLLFAPPTWAKIQGLTRCSLPEAPVREVVAALCPGSHLGCAGAICRQKCVD